MAAVNGKIYALGGLSGVVSSPVFLGTVEVYDPSTSAWSAAPSMPTPRADLAATDANGLVYAIGGYTPDGNTSNAIEQYFPPVTIFTFVKN